MFDYFDGFSVPLKVKNHKNLVILKESNMITNMKDYSLEDYSSLLNINLDILNNYSSWFLLEDGFYFYKSEYILRELFMSEFIKEYKLKTGWHSQTL